MAYLDYNATTPVDGRVIDAMMPLFAEHFGNPSSVHHDQGRTVARIMEEAHAKAAGAIGMGASDVIFTSGATEANNLKVRKNGKAAGAKVQADGDAQEPTPAAKSAV